MRTRLVLATLMFAIGISHLVAQSPVHLGFEIQKNTTVIARPEIELAAGSEGSMEIEGVGSLRFTPTLRGSDLAIAFVINSDGKQLQPRLVLRDAPGSISWTSTGADALVLRVSWRH